MEPMRVLDLFDFFKQTLLLIDNSFYAIKYIFFPYSTITYQNVYIH
jgi:hypothetical protein